MGTAAGKSIPPHSRCALRPNRSGTRDGDAGVADADGDRHAVRRHRDRLHGAGEPVAGEQRLGCSQRGDTGGTLVDDRCAAGTGRFLEVMARALEVDLDRFGEISLKA